MNKTTEHFKCTLKILSPIHIGCDEVYEPTSFVVNETNEINPTMTVFDPMTFISDLDEGEKNHFSEICKKGTVVSILELYKFLRGKKAAGKEVVLSTGFIGHYRKVLGLRNDEKGILNNLNDFKIHRTSFRPYDDRPYIPGSAIKGAMRTAYLNALAQKKNFKIKGIQKNIENTIGKPVDKNKAIKLSELEKSLQSKLFEYKTTETESDPFRLVKISDFQPVGNVQTKIVYAVNKKKKISNKEPGGLSQILEVIQPGAVFTGQISVEQPTTDEYIKQPIDLDTLLKSCSDFYSDENQRENRELGIVDIIGVDVEGGKDNIPIRLGRHSGAESLTINGYRSISIMQKKSFYIYKPTATTFWLASERNKASESDGLKTFGWASFSALTPEFEKSLNADEIVFRSEFERKALEIADARKNEREEALRVKEEAERKKKEEEEKQAREAARIEAEKQRLASMTPGEIMLEEIASLSEDTNENAPIIAKVVSGDFDPAVYKALKEKLIELDQWNPKGAKQRKTKMQKRNKNIELKIKGGN